MDLTLISDWHGLFFVASFNAENIYLKIASSVGFEKYIFSLFSNFTNQIFNKVGLVDKLVYYLS